MKWGWGGTYDGWFSSRLLDDGYIAVDDAESFDSPPSPEAGNSDNFFYDHWFRMIEYSK